MPMSALRGLKVLDLTQQVAGPYCTRLLAGLGADVVKVEPPEGDPARRLGPHPPSGPHPEQSALFLYLNQGKRSIALDLHAASDRAYFTTLLRAADVLVESFPPATSRDLGLAYEQLRPLNPTLIVTAVTPFGGDGPYCAYHSPEIVAHALGGLLHLTGEPSREPLPPAGWQASYIAGATAAVGTLLALHHRHRVGRGQQVDVAIMESLASVLEGAIPHSASGEQPRGRRGNNRGADYPTMLLPCLDGYILIAIASAADWEGFTYFVGDERLQAPQFASPAMRREHAAELAAILTEWLRPLRRHSVFAAAQAWRFPCCPVLAVAELPADPQHRARRFFTWRNHPVAGRLRYPGAPFRLSATPWHLGRAPLLGEHSTTVLDRWRSAPPGPSKVGVPDAAECLGKSSAALRGVRVLDLTSIWAGPYCTRLLADAGAEVIKIELAARPDGTRRRVMGADAAENATEPASFFVELNRNKLGITLDLRAPDDRAHFHRLVDQADAVVENCSPRVMPNLGFDYAALRAIRSDIIVLSMPAFGGEGPYRDAVAYGSGIEAASGLASLNGYPDGPPALLGVAYGDPVAGLHGAVALLAALEHRRRSGEGQHIELAQREALTQFLGEAVVADSQGASVAACRGARHAEMAPHGCYRCRGRDRWVAIAVEDEQQWQRLCGVLGHPELAAHERFADVQLRLANHDILDRIIEQWTRRREHRAVMRLLQAAGVPAGAVLDPGELLADAHLAARGFFVPIVQAGAAPRLYPGAICRLSASPLAVQRPAPLLGEHDGLLLPETR